MVGCYDIRCCSARLDSHLALLCYAAAGRQAEQLNSVKARKAGDMFTGFLIFRVLNNLMKKLVLLFSLQMFCLSAFACLNNYFHNANGQSHGQPYLLNEVSRSFPSGYLNKKALQLEDSIKAGGNYQHKSDYASILLKLGRTNEGLNILKALAVDYGEEYNVAANLGTAYELSGMNDSALYWIKKGIEINPQSHQGSEWVHVKILEAKIKMKDDPSWLAKNSVIGLKKDREAATLFSGEWKKRATMLKHLQYQLKERIPFTPSPDPLVANLLEDLGDLYYLDVSVETASIVYQMAFIYSGGENADLVKKAGQALYLTQKYKEGGPPNYTVNKIFGMTKAEKEMLKAIVPVETAKEEYIQVDTVKAKAVLAQVDSVQQHSIDTAAPARTGDDYSRYTRKTAQDYLWKFSAAISLFLLFVVLMLLMKRRKK